MIRNDQRRPIDRSVAGPCVSPFAQQRLALVGVRAKECEQMHDGVPVAEDHRVLLPAMFCGHDAQ